MTAWWATLAPVTLSVPCRDQNHLLRWAEGRLTAPGHPDADRERALAALGADPSPCLQILDAWNRHADDLDVLVLASRGPSDPLDESRLNFARHHMSTSYSRGPLSHATMAYASTVRHQPARFGWTAYGPMGMRRYVDPDNEAPTDELARLLSLGSGLPQRLASTVIATWAERIDAGDERIAVATPALDAALYGRLRSTLLPWLGNPAKIELTMLPPGAEPALRRAGDVVRVELPFAWLRDVWANGLVVILDRFCVRAQHTAPRGWTLTTVNRELTERRTVTING